MSDAQLASDFRSGCAIGSYRFLLNLALLATAFHDFPDHRTVIVLALLVFSQGIAAVLVVQRITFAQQNRLDDLAERKTRHAILLASDPDRSQYHFWTEVDRRVEEEKGPPEKSPAWWTQIGLWLFSISGYLIGDLLTVALAAVIAG